MDRYFILLTDSGKVMVVSKEILENARCLTLSHDEMVCNREYIFNRCYTSEEAVIAEISPEGIDSDKALMFSDGCHKELNSVILSNERGDSFLINFEQKNLNIE
jgi:hypothetical protein